MPSARDSLQEPGKHPASLRTPQWNPIIAGALLILATVLVYFGCFTTPFHFDDEPAVLYNPTIRRLWPPGEALSPLADGSGVSGRPLVNLSLAVNYAVGGLDPRGYHGLNVGLHALAVLALWGVLRRTLRRLPELAGKAEALAWGCALGWGVHPLLTESVVCVVQRNEIMGGLFYLLTLYGFIRAAEAQPVGRDQRPRPAIWLGVSVIACLLGMASKEIVVTAPLLVLLYDRTFVAGSFASAWRQRKSFYLALACTWLLLAWLMLGNKQRGGTVGFGLGMSSWDYLVTQCRALAIYLKLSLWPHPLIVDYGTALSALGEVWGRGLLIIALLGTTLWALWRRPVPGFVGAWFFVILAPSSSVVPLTTQTVAEHRMYLPLIAVVVLVGAALQRWAGRHGLLIGGVVVAGLAGLTIQRNHAYISELSLWSETAAEVPGNQRAHLNLGQVLFKLGRMPEAAERFEKALHLAPSYAEAHYNLGLTQLQLGRLEEAIGHFEAALRLVPHYAVAHNDLGIALAQSGQTDTAKAHFEAALRIRPDFAGAHYNLANLLLRMGRPGEAIPQYELAIGQNAAAVEYHSNLAIALMQAGRTPEAIGHYATAVRLKSDSPELRLNLALTLAAGGRLREAIRQLEEALRLRPDYAAAIHYLTQMQADLNHLEGTKP